jgi:hypothetical protein
MVNAIQPSVAEAGTAVAHNCPLANLSPVGFPAAGVSTAKLPLKTAGFCLRNFFALQGGSLKR